MNISDYMVAAFSGQTNRYCVEIADMIKLTKGICRTISIWN